MTVGAGRGSGRDRKTREGQMLRDILKSLSFHGVKHLASDSAAVRRCWSALLLTVCACSVWVFRGLLARYLAAPTLLTVTRQQGIVSNFPNLIICPETNFPEERIDHFMTASRMPPNVSEADVRSRIRQLAAFMDPDVVFSVRALEFVEGVLHYNTITVPQATLLLMPACEDIILKCLWQGVEMDCKDIFMMVMTGDGYCCSFNGRSIRETEFEPMPVLTGGVDSGLTMMLSHAQELPTSVDLGYKWLVIQDSSRFYEVKNNGTAISRGSEYFFGFHIRRLTSSPDVSKLEKSLRNCVENYENPLKLFPTYDRNYCITECAIWSSMRRCGCVLHTFPVPAHIPMCHARYLPCAQRAVGMASCDCPEACEFVVSHFTTNLLSLEQPVHAINSFYEGLDPANMSIVRVFSTMERQLETRRDCLFPFFSLISQLGGVFGAYLGCSFISGVEVLFLVWRTLRRMLERQKRRRRRRGVRGQ